MLWGGRGSRRRQTPGHGQVPRRNKKAEGEQGNTSNRATTPAKQKQGVAHRMRSGGRPIRPGQDKGMAHHTRSGGRLVRLGHAKTTDTQNPKTPAVRRRGQQRTNKTSRQSRRLKYHEPKPDHTKTARPKRGVPHTNTARPNMGGGGARTSTAPTPARQTKQPQRNPTADHSHPSTPIVRRRRRRRINRTSCAWRRLKHHQLGPSNAGRH